MRSFPFTNYESQVISAWFQSVNICVYWFIQAKMSDLSTQKSRNCCRKKALLEEYPWQRGVSMWKVQPVILLCQILMQSVQMGRENDPLRPLLRRPVEARTEEITTLKIWCRPIAKWKFLILLLSKKCEKQTETCIQSLGWTKYQHDKFRGCAILGKNCVDHKFLGTSWLLCPKMKTFFVRV